MAQHSVFQPSVKFLRAHKPKKVGNHGLNNIPIRMT